MVNKSMMHTHASGCHKRRSLPAHSLAVAGLSLLLAFSCPLAVRADTNLSAEEAIYSFYEKNVPNNIGNSNKFDHFSWSNNNILGKTYDVKPCLHVLSSVRKITETGNDDYYSKQEFNYENINVGSNETKTLIQLMVILLIF